jgi:ParB/RepB/Spo0J family partition protein
MASQISRNASLGELTPVAISLIDAGNNDRKKFKEGALKELADSLSQHGLIQPITLRPKGRSGRFEIIAGERRFRAAQIAGWQEIPSIVKKVKDDPASAMMLAENTGRVNLDPMEEARAYRRRQDQGWETERIAKIAGVSEDLVKRRIGLLQLMPVCQDLVASGEYPIGHAELMVRLDAGRQQIAHRVFLRSQKGIARQAFKDICDQLQAEQDQGALFEMEEFFLQSVQVNVKHRGKEAHTGAPTRSDLPIPTTTAKDSVATILDRYIHDLIKAGHLAEAGAVGTVYDVLVRSNFLSVPATSALLGKSVA